MSIKKRIARAMQRVYQRARNGENGENIGDA